MAKIKKGKDISKMNAVKSGLYLKFSDFFPCNLCAIKEKCEDFIPGGHCSIDEKKFNELTSKEIDELKILNQLINYNLVRLSRANELSKDRPEHIELSRISAEIRNLVQTHHIIKSRMEAVINDKQTKLLQHLPKKGQLQLIQRE